MNPTPFKQTQIARACAIALSVSQLQACTTIGAALENRAVCTLNADKSMVVSQWGGFGIATKLSDADTPYLCAKAVPSGAASSPVK